MVVLLGYKIGDGFGTRMIKPFLVDQGWSQAAIGRLDLVASLTGLLAAALAGLLMLWLSRKAALIGFGLLQALAFVGQGGFDVWDDVERAGARAVTLDRLAIPPD